MEDSIRHSNQWVRGWDG